MSTAQELVAKINAAYVVQGLAPTARVAADGSIVSSQSSRNAMREGDRIRRRTRVKTGGLRTIIADCLALVGVAGLTITEIGKAADRTGGHINAALDRMMADGTIGRIKEATPAGKKFRWRYFLNGKDNADGSPGN